MTYLDRETDQLNKKPQLNPNKSVKIDNRLDFVSNLLQPIRKNNLVVIRPMLARWYPRGLTTIA